MALTALITGASSGIGRELARLFAADGFRLVLVARREQQLRELADSLRAEHRATVDVVPVDLSNPSELAALEAELTRRGVVVDVLVNNAGFGAVGDFAELSLQRQLEMIQVNVTALTQLTRCFLPGMLARNEGGVLNVASTAAFQPGPTMAVYYATKAFVLSLTEALREEVRGSRLGVTCLAPGPTATEFGEQSGMSASRLFRWGGMLSAAVVARAGYRGFRRGKTLVVPGWSNKLGVWSVRFTPRPVVRKVVRWLQTRQPP